MAETKYIFVTGGVVSSLGKGIISSSIGKLLQARGYNITIQKFDPYINIDPGTLNPYEHGECYVTVFPSLSHRFDHEIREDRATQEVNPSIIA